MDLKPTQDEHIFKNDDIPLLQFGDPNVGDKLSGRIDDAALMKEVNSISFSCIGYKKRIIATLKESAKGEDERSKDTEIETLSEVIQDIYKDLLEKREPKDTDVNLLWGNNLSAVKKTQSQLMVKRIEKDSNNWEHKDMSDSHSDSEPKRKSAKFSFYNEEFKKTGVQPVPIIAIPKVEQLPRCNYWTKTKKNVLTDDSKFLTHLPYFNEDVGEEFFSGLLKNYDNKFHKEERSENENNAFFELVHTVKFGLENRVTMILSRRRNNLTEIGLTPQSPGKGEYWKVSPTYPSYNIFNAIGKALPDLGIPKDLSNWYVEACKKIFPWRPTSTDSTNGARDKDDVLPLFAQQEDEEGVAIEYKEEVCRNKNCIKKAQGGLKVSKEESISFDENEKLLYDSLSRQFPNSPCFIAQLLVTKTCQDVFYYSQRNEEIERKNRAVLKDEQIIGTPRTENMKKKQKKSNDITRWIRYYISKIEPPSDQKNGLHPNYTPCFHVGECSKINNCQCYESGTACDKYCACPITCLRRFPGCSCKSTCSTNTCPCRSLSRECDPALCGTCQEDCSGKSCRNDSMRCRKDKKCTVKISPVNGYGLFIDEPVSKGEYIIEYCGEKISHDEAERRGAIYDKRRHTFLFDLNKYYVLDATRMGSDARFLNSSEKPNCEPKALLIDGDHRLGIFAARDISEGEELFFNYHSVLNQHKVRNETTTKRKKSKAK